MMMMIIGDDYCREYDVVQVVTLGAVEYEHADCGFGDGDYCKW